MAKKGSIFVNVGANIKDFTNKMNKVGLEMKKMKKTAKRTNAGITAIGKSMVGFGKNMSMAMTLPLTVMGTTAVKESANFEGAMARFKVIFRDNLDGMKDWVNEYRKEFPLARSEIVGMSSTLADLMIPMGIARNEAGSMTKEFMHVAGAMSALYDEDMDVVLEAVKSGLAGFSRPLRRFGVDASVASLEQEALRLGLMKTGEEMTNQVRIQALLSQVYKQSQDALVGLEEQKGSLLWKLQELKASFKDFMKSLGDELLPIVSRVVDILVKWMNAFENMSAPMKKVIVAVGVILAIIPPLVLALGSILLIIPSLQTGWGMLVYGLKNFKKALIAVKSMTLSALPIIGAIALIAFIIYKNWDKLKPVFKKTFDAFKGALITSWNMAKMVFGKVWELIKTVGTIIWDEIGDGVIEVFKMIGQAFKILFDYYKTAVSVLIPIFSKIFDFIIKTVGTAVQNIINMIKGVIQIFSGIGDLLAGIFLGDFSMVEKGLKKMFKGVVNFFKGILKTPIKLLTVMLNKVIGGLNSVHIKVPKWIPKWGGKEFGFNIPKIPQLAEGGLVKATHGGILANIGEGGQDELVIPLSKVNSILGNNNQRADIRVYLDRQLLTEVIGQELMKQLRVRVG